MARRSENQVGVLAISFKHLTHQGGVLSGDIPFRRPHQITCTTLNMRGCGPAAIYNEKRKEARGLVRQGKLRYHNQNLIQNPLYEFHIYKSLHASPQCANDSFFKDASLGLVSGGRDVLQPLLVDLRIKDSPGL